MVVVLQVVMSVVVALPFVVLPLCSLFSSFDDAHDADYVDAGEASPISEVTNALIIYRYACP